MPYGFPPLPHPKATLLAARNELPAVTFFQPLYGAGRQCMNDRRHPLAANTHHNILILPARFAQCRFTLSILSTSYSPCCPQTLSSQYMRKVRDPRAASNWGHQNLLDVFSETTATLAISLYLFRYIRTSGALQIQTGRKSSSSERADPSSSGYQSSHRYLLPSNSP